MKILSYFSVHFLPLILLLFAWGCSGPPLKDSDLMSFDSVDYISGFAKSFTLRDRMSPAIDIIGARNFAVIGNKMVLNSTDPSGFISVLSLPDHRYLGKYITQGDGPLELTQSPSASSQTKLTSESGEVFAYIYDFQKGRIMKLNVNQSIKVDSMVLTPIDESLPSFLTGITILDSSTILYKELYNKEAQHRRHFHQDTDPQLSGVLEKLNKASVSPGEDFNILASVTKYSASTEKFVEMPLNLNYINIYSRDGTFTKTVCMGEKLVGVSEVEQTSRADRMYVFSDLRVYDDFFGVLYINQTARDYEITREKTPSILLFDWQGNPIIELKLDHHATTFDIDFVNDELYTFDVQSDEFAKYAIGKILSEL